MVTLLAKSQQGTILSSVGRAYALHLMSDIDPAQQFGVGITARPNTTYAMEADWVVIPDNSWTTDFVVIVKTAATTYISAAYAQERVTEDSGFAAIDIVCRDVAQQLDSHTA